MKEMNLSSLTAVGGTTVQVGSHYRALLRGSYFKKGDTVEVVYVGPRKITFKAPRVQLSMLPADFLNAFTPIVE